jgi:hypothetical protein
LYLFSSTFVWWRCLLRFVLRQVTFPFVFCSMGPSKLCVCASKLCSGLLGAVDGGRGLAGGGGGFAGGGGSRVRRVSARAASCHSWPVSCSARARDTLSRSPSRAAVVRTPTSSIAVAVAVACHGHTRPPPLVRPQVSLLLSFPPPLLHLSSPILSFRSPPPWTMDSDSYKPRWASIARHQWRSRGKRKADVGMNRAVSVLLPRMSHRNPSRGASSGTGGTCGGSRGPRSSSCHHQGYYEDSESPFPLTPLQVSMKSGRRCCCCSLNFFPCVVDFVGPFCILGEIGVCRQWFGSLLYLLSSRCCLLSTGIVIVWNVLQKESLRRLAHWV